MNRSFALALKDLRLLVRDKAALFWVLGFPLMMAIIFGSVFGGSNGPSKIDVSILDQDKTQVSSELIKKLEATQALNIIPEENVASPLEVAANSVRQGKLAAYILIPRGFQDEVTHMDFAKGPGLRIGSDPSHKAESGILQGIVGAASGEIIGDQFGGGSKVHGPEIAADPITAKGETPGSPFEITFPQALIWGLLGVISSFAISMVKEREQGTLMRLQTSMSMSEILMGKALACLIASLGMMAVLLFIGHLVFGVRISSPLLLAMALVSGSLCIVGIMMLLSVLGRTEQAVSGSSWGIMITMSMFGGGMIPIFMMPGWMKTASDASPLKWTVLSIEGAIWRGFSLTEMLTPCLILLSIGAVCFGLGVRVLRARA
jgi:ABC-2 type transport system permease protein